IRLIAAPRFLMILRF
ncbi:putative trypsin domain protein, partial [Vibrio parahaemolyticus V-223/04]